MKHFYVFLSKTELFTSRECESPGIFISKSKNLVNASEHDFFLKFLIFDPFFKRNSSFCVALTLYFFILIILFTFSSHTEYVKRESIVIAWVKKKTISPFDKCSCFVCFRRQNKQKKFPSVCLSVCLYVRMWTFHVDTITFEGVSGSKQNLVGVFYVWNVGLVLKFEVKSWSRS